MCTCGSWEHRAGGGGPGVRRSVPRGSQGLGCLFLCWPGLLHPVGKLHGSHCGLLCPPEPSRCGLPQTLAYRRSLRPGRGGGGAGSPGRLPWVLGPVRCGGDARAGEPARPCSDPVCSLAQPLGCGSAQGTWRVQRKPSCICLPPARPPSPPCCLWDWSCCPEARHGLLGTRPPCPVSQAWPRWNQG